MTTPHHFAQDFDTLLADAAMAAVSSLVGRIETWTPQTTEHVMPCPHCGWHAIIVRTSFYEAARSVRVDHERHPDRRATVETECPVRGAYWIGVGKLLRQLPIDAQPDVIGSAIEGYARGRLFRLIEVESMYSKKPSAVELATREIYL